MSLGKKSVVCLICRYEWVSRVRKPKECPRCKSRAWHDGVDPKYQPDEPTEDDEKARAIYEASQKGIFSEIEDSKK